MKTRTQQLEELAEEMLDFIAELAIVHYARVAARMRLAHFERKFDRITKRKKP